MVSFRRGVSRACTSLLLLASTACSLSLGLDTLDSDPAGGAAGGVTGLAGQTAAGGADMVGQGGAPTAGQGGGANGGTVSSAGFPAAGGTGGIGGKTTGGAGGKSTGGGSGGPGGTGTGGAPVGGTGGLGGSGGVPMAGSGGSAGAPKGAITLATNQKTPVGIGLDDLHVYWVNVAPAAIYRVLKTGGNPEALVTSVDLDDPRDVIVNGPTLYWSE